MLPATNNRASHHRRTSTFLILRIKRDINSLREHAELLSSVRDDISEYKASCSVSPRMQLLRERPVVHGSISHLKKVLGANSEAPLNIECLMDDRYVRRFIHEERRVRAN
ncbi:hypothetical protein ACS0TY_017489 [Phlomoides rotata]